MTRSLRNFYLIVTLLSLVISVATSDSASVLAQTRLERAPARSLETTPTLPAGTRVIPPGTVIILEMDDRLSSSSSRVSDRFRAHVASPVMDETGRTIIPVGTIVEGHVAAVSKAKWARRSGIISIVFDSFRKPDGSAVPVKGTLTSADAEDRKRLDEEGYLKGPSTTRRDIVFIGGGAGAGAAIGAVTGGALLGGGIGAAAGLTATLLMKGKEVHVNPGERFGMELTQQIPADFLIRTVSPIGSTRPTRPTVPGPYRPPTAAPTPVDPNRQLPGALNPYDVTALRDSDGSALLRINAEAPSSGWRVFTHHENAAAGTVRIRLRGTPPPSTSPNAQLRQMTLTPAPEICLEDRGRTLRRAELLDRNGRVRITVEIPTSGSRYARAQATPTAPGTVPGTTIPPVTPVEPGYPSPTQPTAPPSSIAAMAESASRQVDVIRRQHANNLGYLINSDGSLNFIGTQRPSQDQEQFLSGLGSLYTSLQTLRANANNPNTLRSSLQRVQEDLSFTHQVWQRVRLDATLNSRWNNAYRDINTLLNAGR